MEENTTFMYRFLSFSNKKKKAFGGEGERIMRPKLTWEVIDKAEELLKAGHYVVTVANYLGISEQTWYNWYNKGEKYSQMTEEEKLEYQNVELYVEFFDTVKRATARAEMDSVEAILKAGKKSWQAHAWYLERKFRDRWGRPTREEQGEGTDTSALDKFISQMSELAERTLEEDE